MAASTCNEDDAAPVGQALPLLWRDEGSVLMMAREAGSRMMRGCASPGCWTRSTRLFIVD